MNIGIKVVLSRIRLFFILYLILLTACFIIKLLFTKDEIYFAVNSRYSDWADFIAPYITDIGNGWTTVALSAVLSLFSYRSAFLLATSYAITSLSVQVIKRIADAPRPKLYFQGRLDNIHFVKGQYTDLYNSFPSGHTLTAFSTALVIIYLTKNKSWSILLFLIAIAVGYSRMYLSEHFFEDVVAGSAWGVFITIFWLTYIDGKAFLHSPKWTRGLLRRSALRSQKSEA
jgi:membrane-associated phospholipid phosphatase